jgi:hypothetical protein
MRTGQRIRRALLLLSLAWCLGVTGALVDAANLLDHEQLWPYRVTLKEAWQPAGAAVRLAAGTAGVLIRVETGGVARIDFSSDGKYEVPIEKTDLVENANRIRRGELAKRAPNFFYAIGTHLVDSGADSLTPFPPETIADRRTYLCVFADPHSDEFAKLAKALRPLKERSDLQTLLFPQDDEEPDDAATREKLRKVDWTVPFVYGFLSAPYARTLVRDGTRFPAVLLVTNEGRLLFQETWQASTLPRLQAVLDARSENR